MAFGITTFAEAPFSAQGQQNAVVAVTGLASTLALGSTTIGLVPSITGQSMNTAVGNVGAAIAATPTGQTLSSALGSPAI